MVVSNFGKANALACTKEVCRYLTELGAAVMMSEEALFAALVEEHAAAAERASEDGIYRDMIKAQLQPENWKILKLNNLNINTYKI